MKFLYFALVVVSIFICAVNIVSSTGVGETVLKYVDGLHSTLSDYMNDDQPHDDSNSSTSSSDYSTDEDSNNEELSSQDDKKPQDEIPKLPQNE